MPDQPPVMEVRHLCKAFGGVRALKDVHFELPAGEIHALLGENGAGQSTLITIMTGFYQPKEGAILCVRRGRGL